MYDSLSENKLLSKQNDIKVINPVVFKENDISKSNDIRSALERRMSEVRYV